MPFTVIQGTFHVVNYSPDGDSIRFKANNPDHWSKLDGPAVGLNAKNHAQLRFEAIDALETHYKGQHQPRVYAEAALRSLLSDLRITQVVRDPNTGIVKSAQDGTSGYIVTRTTERNQRPVAFVFSGKPAVADGSSINLSVADVKKSVNLKQVSKGFAFPTYYQGLFFDLRDTFTAATQKARRAKRGFWPMDKTNSGVAIQGLKSVTEDAIVLPKLFRRLVEYLEAGGNISGFRGFLAKKKEPLHILSTGHFTHFDTVVKVSGNTVKLTVPPEDLVFQE